MYRNYLRNKIRTNSRYWLFAILIIAYNLMFRALNLLAGIESSNLYLHVTKRKWITRIYECNKSEINHKNTKKC